jgi:N-acetylmuramoyl-L-alanine amidase
LSVITILTLAAGAVLLQLTGRPALASDPPAHIIVEGREALFMVSPTVGDNDTVFAPVDFVHMLGAEFKKVDDRTVSITSTDGRTFTSSYTYSNDRYIVAVQPIAKQLGADISWDGDSRALTLRAKVLVVRVDGGKLAVATSYPINYRTGVLSSPYRAYVDLFGAVLPGSASIPIKTDGVSQIRAKQMEFNTVRVALDMGNLPKLALGPGNKSARIQIPLTGAPISAPPTQIAAANPTPAPPPLAVAKPTPQTSDPSPFPTVAPPAAKPSVGQPPVPVVVASARVAPEPATVAPRASKSGGPFRITAVDYLTTPDNKPAIVITTEGKPLASAPRTEQLDSPARFSIDLQGADLALPTSGPNSQIAVTNPVIKGIRWGTLNLKRTTFGRIVLDLTRQADFRIAEEKTDDGNGQRYTVTLAEDLSSPVPTVPSDPVMPIGDLPPGTTPPVITPPGMTPPSTTPPTTAPLGPTSPRPVDINRMTVIIDAGHGGKDGGAPGGGELWEKNLNLQIAKRVRDVFTEAGATVLMTRSDDTFIPLPDRSQLGNDKRADLFISIHCDSGNSRNANSGSTIYYHGNQATCKEIAADIASRLKESNCGIPVNGTRTDFVRFPGVGFSVLRRSASPAVLVECGYINCDTDAQALQQADTQDLIAKSILAGVKDYVANRVARN